ncbi:hypothetical protein TNCV_4996931 [Trichonephila clavipes]|nr:hypothetical protein TNCV_4996931 [Trichonephila clavipes]
MVLHVWNSFRSRRLLEQSCSRCRSAESFINTSSAGSHHLRSVYRGNGMNSYSTEELKDVLIVYGVVLLYQGCYSNKRVPRHTTFASVNRS